MSKFGLKDGSVKLAIGWLVVFVIRLLPFRPPNVEPVLATLMPFSKKYGLVGGFLFAFLSIFLFDLAVAQVGIWTLVTAVTYGCIGLASGIYFKNREGKAVEYLKFSIVGTLLYDAITGPGMAYVFGHPVPFQEALIGQIPFTLLHLLSNGLLALTVSPMLYRWVVANPTFEVPALLDRFAFSKR